MSTRHPMLDAFIEQSLAAVPDDVGDLIQAAGTINSFMSGNEHLVNELQALADSGQTVEEAEEEVVELFVTHISFQLGLVNELLNLGLLQFELPNDEEE